MKITFKTVKIHNFLSIGDASIDLQNRGYVLVEGKNNNPGDGAISNGSGKSSIWNSICWCLTGETIQGLKSNITNIHCEDGCYVTLQFKVDSDDYEVTRYRDYGSIKNDLKIVINGEDKSGKGLRESEALLNQYLPDMTSDLIGNVVMLGQGLPHKFSSNTPSGRKELLEKLSKSDFMIADLKARVSGRLDKLSDDLRAVEDELLKTNTEIQVFTNQLDSASNELKNLVYDENTDTEIAKLIEGVSNLNKLLDESNNNKHRLTEELTTKQNDAVEFDKTTYDLIDKLKLSYVDKLDPVRLEISSKTLEYQNLKSEIARLDSVTDVCPTCGQKLPGIQKIDTSNMKKDLKIKEDALVNLTEDLSKLESKLNSDIAELNTERSNEKIKMSESLNNLRSEISKEDSNISNYTLTISDNNLKINNLNNIKNNYETAKAKLEQTISELSSNIDTKTKNVNDLSLKQEDINNHIGVINKMITLLKRDFRGILLINVIDYINKKAKEYCKYVFNTDNIEISLDGNNLNIAYDSKDYANLSGGEKQKVDIVTQFAIRDMLSNYLGFRSNILVIDEVFDNLDEAGVQGVLNLINNILTDIDSLFIISHHSDELGISSDDVITVVKDYTGVSKIV